MSVDRKVALPENSEMVVIHPRVEVRQSSHELEVGGEEGEGGGVAEELLADGPADGAARVHGGAPPQLVQHDEGSGAPVGQQVSRLLHLHHELG